MKLKQSTEAWGLNINKFNGGTVTLFDDARIKLNQAVETTNLMQVQDGIWKPRWGTEYYGEAIAGETKIAGIAEYVKSDGSRELIAVGGTTGKIFKSVDAGAWSQIGSLTLNTTVQPSFLQIEGFLYIANGIDNLVRYNGTSLLTYTQLSAPTLSSANRGSGLSAGSFTYYYKVTALNEVGETTGSNEVSTTVNVDRDLWGGSGNRHIDVTWTAVSGATRYQLYISEESGKQTLLIDTAATTYRDDGSVQVNLFIQVPQDNTTTAPKFSEMSLIDGRIWGTKEPSNKYRVYWGGDELNTSAFSAYYGGGWVDLERGGRETPVWVGNYRTGKGDSAATVLCTSPEGVGSVWQLSLQIITVNNDSFVYPTGAKIVGTIGTTSPKAVVTAMDSLIFANKRAIYNLGNKQQIFNVLATDEMSANIRPSYRELNQNKLGNMCAYWYDSKIFFSATEKGQNDNNLMFVFDTERKNWAWRWTIGVNQFLEYTEITGTSYLLGIRPNDNRLMKFDSNLFSDLGQKFRTSYTSGLIQISDNAKMFAMVKEVLIELGRPKGKILFEVIGIKKKGGFNTIATRTITNEASISNVNFTDSLFSDIFFSENPNVPTTVSQANVKKIIRVRKLLNAIQYKVSSDTLDTDYAILAIQAYGNLIPTSSPSDWKR
jgi:hypothetical protein